MLLFLDKHIGSPKNGLFEYAWAKEPAIDVWLFVGSLLGGIFFWGGAFIQTPAFEDEHWSDNLPCPLPVLNH